MIPHISNDVLARAAQETTDDGNAEIVRKIAFGVLIETNREMYVVLLK